jgi:[protein-PII] uridylyltransferase
MGPAESLSRRIQVARESAFERLRQGESGGALAAHLTRDFEAPIVEMMASRFRGAGLGTGSGTGIVILTTGGFGRREFAPYSDLDLVFLCRNEPDETVIGLATSILGPIWDARLDAGHAVRSVEEAMSLSATDLTAATAMLEARYLIGDEQLLSDFLTQYNASASGPDGLVRRLREEQEKRHRTFGDTIYLLEPDIKSGPGGYRDLCVGRWAAHARFGTGDPEALVAQGQMLRQQAESFERARQWILRTRIALHLVAKRKIDHLRFDLQEQIGPILYGNVSEAPGRIRSEVAPVVEALMGDHQIHARTIVRETERLLQRAVADLDREPTNFPLVLSSAGRGVDPNFVIRDGLLEVLAPDIFEQKPSEMMRLFAASLERKIPVGLRSSDWITELCAETPGLLSGDPEAARWFLQVLTNPNDAGTPSRLEQMQDVGLLSSLIPEWGPVTGRVQYDLYHVYTVDQHSHHSVAMLKALARREWIDQFPIQVEQMALVEEPRALYVAMFLHDAGKPLGPHHPKNGAELGARIAARLGLNADEVERVRFLILHHLTLAHISQRRDLSDSRTIEHTAQIVGTAAALIELYVLTFSDLCSVGPGTLTPWKENLLRELFMRTLAYVRHGPESVEADLRERVLARRQRVTEFYDEGRPVDDVKTIVDSLPDRYFIENTTARAKAHVELIRNRKGPCAVDFVHHEKRGFTEMILVAEDVPGLLATVTGVLYANRVDILEASIYTRPRPGGSSDEALDIFRIRRAHHGAIDDESRLQSIRADLEATLSGIRPVAELVAARPRTSSMFERAKPKVPPTEVALNNEFSPRFTIIDVFTEDRAGVLYRIARVLYECGLDIRRAKVGVEADRVADVFYVRDRDHHGQVTDPARLASIEAALLSALAVPRT